MQRIMAIRLGSIRVYDSKAACCEKEGIPYNRLNTCIIEGSAFKGVCFDYYDVKDYSEDSSNEAL